jgi:DNA transposition AAA+ family ATPase
MKDLYQRFSSIDLLNFLFTKIEFMFHAQQYITTILKDAKRKCRMVGVLGREGMGKSSAIAHFIQNEKGVYYLRIGTTYTVSNLFNEMLHQVSGVYPTVHETLFIKMKRLSYLLTKDNSKKLVVIDDAGRLSPRALSTWFELRDNTIQTTGFVFIGLDYFLKNLLNAKKNGVAGIAEFYRRVENWYSVPGLKNTEKSQYGLKRRLSHSEVLLLHDQKIETIAELENYVSALLEEKELAQKEERQPKPIRPHGERDVCATKVVGNPDNDDNDDDDDDDDMAITKKEKKRQQVKKAREARVRKTSSVVENTVA